MLYDLETRMKGEILLRLRGSLRMISAQRACTMALVALSLVTAFSLTGCRAQPTPAPAPTTPTANGAPTPTPLFAQVWRTLSDTTWLEENRPASAAAQTLELEFQDGSVYQYYGVPEFLHEQFMQASSKGQFLNQYIRNAYPYSRVG